jgi:hypothetical protein
MNFRKLLELSSLENFCPVRGQFLIYIIRLGWKLTDNDKHSSLSWFRINHNRKKFYHTGPRTETQIFILSALCNKTFLVKFTIHPF